MHRRACRPTTPWTALVLIAAWGWLAGASPADAQCRRVADSDAIRIDAKALARLDRIGMDRQKIFEALRDVSIPETGGCWAGATGNFDEQIVSVGVLQWNYGQNSLQPNLRRYRNSFNSRAAFDARVAALMPNHGGLIFSEGCLRPVITLECKAAILALQDAGKLQPALAREFDALFESDEMVQIQTNRFVALVESVADDLTRLFPGEAATPRRIKWAIDTKVQQGGFPGDEDISRIRKAWADTPNDRRAQKLNSLIRWYEALATSVDQGGTRLDWEWNVARWRQKIDANGISDEQADLLHLTFLRSRIASGQSGHWQALTFQRRATIILGLGSVAGHRRQ